MELSHNIGMTCYQEITCPNCGGKQIMTAGRSTEGAQRYRCQEVMEVLKHEPHCSG